MMIRRVAGTERASIVVFAAFVLSSALVGGCKRASHLADFNLRHPEVKTVSHYGVTLDKDASPKQVAYVLLRAISDDLQADSREAREKALDVQFDLCAANVLRKGNGHRLSDDEFLYEAVRRWAPTVAYYAADLPADWESAQERLIVKGASGAGGATQEKQLALIQLADPSGDPNATVVLFISMVKDAGYWRVEALAFDPGHRKLATRASVVDPAPTPGD